MNLKLFLCSLVVGFCYAGLGMSAQWPARADFRMALLDALAACHLGAKEICDFLGYTQSQWAKIARGEPGHRLPSLSRLEDGLPAPVWDELLPRISYIVWQRRQQQQQLGQIERAS